MYALVFFPLVTRVFLIMRFRHLMGKGLCEGEQDRETHRAIILPMAGFTFSALLALAVLESDRARGLTFSILSLFISFLGYVEALNLQGHKDARWQDELGNACMEIGSLGLILSMVGVLLSQLHQSFIIWVLSLLAILIWLFDHVIRLRLIWKYLSLKEANHEGG